MKFKVNKKELEEYSITRLLLMRLQLKISILFFYSKYVIKQYIRRKITEYRIRVFKR